MKDELSKQQIEQLLKIMDEMVSLSGWDSSSFLRALNKKLLNLRDDFATKAQSTLVGDKDIQSDLSNRVALRSGQQEVFVGLYSLDGSNIQAWERIIVSLPKQIVSRPVYTAEEDVIQLIRSKENKINEAYVSVYINQSDILALGDKAPMDKFGKVLLSLKDKSIDLDRINKFVHYSGNYRYMHGRLIKET